MLLPIVVVIVGLSAPDDGLASAPLPRHVLLLNSYHDGYRWTDELTAAVKASVGSRADVELHIEYMDAKRWRARASSKSLEGVLAARYDPARGGLSLAAVIVADDHALDLALDRRGTLFAGIPILFAGINDFQPARIEGHQPIGGVVEDYDFAGTLQTIARLHPDLKRLVMVGDQTLSGQAAMRRARRAVASVGGSRPVEVLDNHTVHELERALAQLGATDVVVYVSFLRDRDGQLLTLERSRELVVAATARPVYCFWDYFEGTGLVGGRGLSAGNQGREVSKLVLAILDGQDPATVGVVRTRPNPYVFDWEQLGRFDIDEEDLPAGAVIINRPPSFYRQNRGWIWGIALFLVLEGFLLWAHLRSLGKRRRLEAQLRDAQRLEAVGRLAGGVAHDFRNQLTVVGGYIDMVSRDLPKGGKAKVRLARARAGVRQASALTGKLLSFSRDQTLVPRRLNLNGVLEELADPLAHVLGETISLRLHLAPDLKITNIDAIQLEQALLNLAGNARDAMPEGGELQVTTENVRLEAGDPPRELERGSWVCVRVRDSGVGMAPEVRDRIFEPFFTTKQVGRGTGLGLSMTWGFARQSGGTIRVHSNPKEGAEFTLWFPAVEGVATESPSPRPDGSIPDPPGAAPKRLRVLAVEDEAMLLELLVETLVRAGYDVLSTTDPNEAAGLARDAGPELHLLVTDVVMPVLRGPEVADRVQALVPGLPVLYISGYTRDALDGMVETPTTGFLKKPFTTDELLTRVRELTA